MTGKRVFNLGLPKTGTMSLAEACTTLGMHSIHNPAQPILESRNGRYDYPALRKQFVCVGGEKHHAQVVSDFGSWEYDQLDAAFPDSLFILTVRDTAEWLESCRKMYRLAARTAYRLMTFGTYKYHQERFRWVQKTHTKLVCDYFNAPHHTLPFGWNIEGRFMIWNLCKHPVWEPLCEFLGCDVPSAPFPCANKGHYYGAIRAAERRAGLNSLTVEEGNRGEG